MSMKSTLMDFCEGQAFLAFLDRHDSSFEGNLIYESNGELVVDKETIKIDTNSKMVLKRGMGDVEFSNWTDKGKTIEKYQENFEDKLRMKIGIIKNLIAYRLGTHEEGGIIFFNYKSVCATET